MISSLAISIMLFGHWLADFVWQPDWMGKGKSKNFGILMHHGVRITVGALGTALILAILFDGSVKGAVVWALVNGLAHVAIDAVTSRITGHFWAKEQTHNFFTTIGFDQFLHLALATVTLAYLVL